MKTLEQELAASVYNKVSIYDKTYPMGSPERKKYGVMAHKLPILVRTAGLTKTLEFVSRSKEKPHRELMKHIAEVVAGCTEDEFLEKSRKAELQQYVYWTRKTLLALKWYKRFAESVLDVTSTDVNEQEVRT